MWVLLLLLACSGFCIFVSLHHRARLRLRGGFTLVELLVVIAVVVLLLGLLLPVLGSARRAARAAACLSHLRGLGTATRAYAVDFRQTLPQPQEDGGITPAAARRSALWFNAVDRYLGGEGGTASAAGRSNDAFKQDPVWLELPVVVNGGITLHPEGVRTLKMNEFFGHGPDSTPAGGAAVRFYRLLDVVEPARTVLYGDGRAHDDASATTGNVDVLNASAFGMTATTVSLRHDDAANLAFVDGSAAWQHNPIRQLSSGYRAWFDRYANSPPAAKDYADAVFRFHPRGLRQGPPPGPWRRHLEAGRQAGGDPGPASG